MTLHLVPSRTCFLRSEAKRVNVPLAQMINFAVGFALANWEEARSLMDPFPPTLKILRRQEPNAYMLTLDSTTAAALESLVAPAPGVTVAAVIASQMALLVRDVLAEAAVGDFTIADEMIETAREYRPPVNLGCVRPRTSKTKKREKRAVEL